MTIAEAAEQFPTSLRGYDRQAVDGHLAEVAAKLARAEATIENLRTELDVAAGERQALMRTTDLATRTANEVTAVALAEATERIAVAAADAKMMIAAAEATGEELVAEARRQAADALAHERERLDAETDLLSVLRVAIAAERHALDEHRRQADADLTALADRVLALRTTDPSSLPSPLEILGGLDLAGPESLTATLPDGVQPFLVLPPPAEPAEPVDSPSSEPVLGTDERSETAPPRRPAGWSFPEGGAADASPADGSAGEQGAPEVAAFAVVGAIPAGDDAVELRDATGPRDEVSADAGPPDELDADPDIDPDIDPDVDPDIDAAFDAYFAEDADPEPTRAWMLS